AAPIPLAAPVTIATLPARPRSAISSSPPPLRAELLEQDRYAHGARLDADRARELEDLHQLLLRGAEPEGVLDVQLQPGDVEVRGGDVEGDVDELLDLRLEASVRPGVPREAEVGLEEVGVELEQAVPQRVPVAAPRLEARLQLELPLRER